jgi:hypothetical protein
VVWRWAANGGLQGVGGKWVVVGLMAVVVWQWSRCVWGGGQQGLGSKGGGQQVMQQVVSFLCVHLSNVPPPHPLLFSSPAPPPGAAAEG